MSPAITATEAAALAHQATATAIVIPSLPDQGSYTGLIVEFYGFAALACALAEALSERDSAAVSRWQSRLGFYAEHRRFLSAGLADGLGRLDRLSLSALRSIRPEHRATRAYTAWLKPLEEGSAPGQAASQKPSKAGRSK